MKILILSQYFKPETFIINDISLEMEALGHEVTVLTGKPNYPEGQIFTGYKASGIQTEKHGENIEVLRIPLRPRGSGGALNLILNYFSFVFSAFIFAPWLLRKKKFDLIFVFAVSPITQAMPAIFLKFLKRAKLVLWVQDLWPESLVVTGFIKNKFILSCVQLMVKCIYSFSDLILVQSKSFFDPILKISANVKLAYYPNTYKNNLTDVEAELALPLELDQLLTENFCAVFAGNIGKAQSVETIVAAAEMLRHLKNFKIIFVGSGSSLSWIQQEKKRQHLTNVECVGRFDMSYMPLIYEKSKVMLLTLNADDILKYTLPWKTQSYMASGKPIIGAIDGEGFRVISEAECGFAGPAQNAKTLAINIQKAYEMNSTDLTRLGQNGLSYFQKNFEMKSQVHNLFSKTFQKFGLFPQDSL
jgi:glycosyltransferase involved in cell wall biosynthesis